MPTATDAESHIITYSYLSATDSSYVSYNTANKLFTFTTTASTSVGTNTITIKA